MILTILLGVAGLGLMIFVHELGHFVAAKASGVQVEVFSLGWGTKLVGFTRGGTTYQLSWFPLGGYCKMKGEMAPEIAGGGAGDAAKAPEGGSFTAASPWRRIFISAMGPIFNVIFAFVVFAIIWWAGFAIYSSDNRVVLATDYALDSFAVAPPATAAGLKTGDRVIAIDGAPVDKFQDILEAVSVAPGKPLSFSISRQENGAARTIVLPVTPSLDKKSGAGKIGIYAWMDPVVDTVAAGSAAAIAGLRKGDRLLTAGTRSLRNTMDLSQEIAARPTRLALSFEREGATQSTTLVLMYDEKGAPNVGLGFVIGIYHSPKKGLAGALVKSVEETWSTVVLTIKGIGLLFRGIDMHDAVAGPLRITYYIGTAATSGFQLGFGVGMTSYFRFLAFLSVSLFLMNLLPIPAMDGGQILLFIVEILRGRPVKAAFAWRMQMVGFSLLIILSLFIMFSDVLFFMGR